MPPSEHMRGVPDTFNARVVRFCSYQLRSRGPLNAASDSPWVSGVLIAYAGGYGCLQCWPSLGDPALEVELESLARGRPGILAARALACATKDGDARRQGISHLDPAAIPPSHATLPPGATAHDISAAASEGFTTCKLKAGPDWADMLEEWERAAAIPDAPRLRFDFNASLTAAEAIAFAHSLSDPLRDAIDFVEDPCPFEVKSWLALRDAGIEPAADQWCDTPDAGQFIGILKPARQDAESVIRLAADTGRRLVVTSYMDHPLGVAHAAYWAAAAHAAGIHHGPAGLLTHRLFDETLGFPAPSSTGPHWNLQPGTGLGYNDTLVSLPWQPLVP